MAAPRAKKESSQSKGRMNFRLDPEIKERVARATAISGQGLTDFAASTLSEKADEIIARRDTLPLNRKEYNFFLSVLNNDNHPKEMCFMPVAFSLDKRILVMVC